MRIAQVCRAVGGDPSEGARSASSCRRAEGIAELAQSCAGLRLAGRVEQQVSLTEPDAQPAQRAVLGEQRGDTRVGALEDTVGPEVAELPSAGLDVVEEPVDRR